MEENGIIGNLLDKKMHWMAGGCNLLFNQN